MSAINKDLQEKLLSDYTELVSEGLATLTAIRKKLSAKYNLAYSTVYKITTNGYKSTSNNTPIPVSYDLKTPIRIESKYPKPYIFLGWEIRVELSPFLNIIDQLKKEYDAEVFVTCLWPDDISYLPKELQKYNLLLNDLQLNNNLIFKYVPTHALAMSPVQGWDGAFDKSAIIPGLIKEVKTAMTDKHCKQIMTTGSLGCLTAQFEQYNHITESTSRVEFHKRWAVVNRQNRMGGRNYEIARTYTNPTALIIDIIDENLFLSRYVTMEPSAKCAYDLDKKYTIYGKSYKSTPSALVVGDIHAYGIDNTKFEATKDIIRTLNPDTVVIQDVFDGASINHHELKDFAKIIKFPSLEEEAAVTKNVVKQFCEISNKVIYLHSNHDDFLVKFLSDESNYKIKDNYQIALKLRAWQLENDKHPIIKLLDLDAIKNIKFISVFDNLYISGVLVKHGHEGIAGKRVGFRPLVKIYNKYIQGHTHSPETYRNGMCVGTTSKLKLGYNFGASAWMHTDGLIQPDGSIQSLNVINGTWKNTFKND